MAERGALSLLSLLCLTFLYTETTAAKHVDKGKCFEYTAALLCVCCFTPRLKKTYLGYIVSRVRKKKKKKATHGMQAVGSENQTWELGS